MSSNIKTLTLLEFRAHFIQSAGSHCAILSEWYKRKKAPKEAQLTCCKQETPGHKTRNLPEIT